MKSSCGFLLLITTLFFCPTKAKAEDSFANSAMNPSMVDMYLVIVGRANPIYMRGGHLVLRVTDRGRGLDNGYNWGIFDFDEPNFALRFFKGDLKYTVAASEFKNLLAWYSKKEHRSVWQHKLQLTNQQKTTVLARIAWWMKPENAYYRYDIRENNCTTIVRDMIAEALGVNFKAMYDKVYIDDTYRNFFREAVSPWPPVYVSLDILTNASADHNETAWERMYSPLAIARILADTPAFGDDGLPILNSKLLGPEQSLYRDPNDINAAEANGYIPYAWAILLMCMPLLAYKFRPTPLIHRLATTSFGFLMILFGISAAIYGSIMISGWLFTDRRDLRNNLNLLLFWPSDVIYCVVGYHALRMRRTAGYLKTFFQGSLIIHAIGAIVACAVTTLDLYSQNVDAVLILTVPLLIISYLGERSINHVTWSPVIASSMPHSTKKKTKRRHAA